MKVYIVIELYGGDQTIVSGVISTEDKAKQYIVANGGFIEKYEVDININDLTSKGIQDQMKNITNQYE